ncbi:MAG: transglutaminase family protein [Planctomycetaceae bacterium]|nr:transglutaminase family protein [Planctomycetaceae bacterium]
MKYTIKHRTWYAYAEAAPVCHNMLHLAPRASKRQVCAEYRLQIVPEPAFMTSRTDWFGNIVDYFSIEGSHNGLEVTARSVVQVLPTPQLTPSESLPWEVAARQSTTEATSADLSIYQLTLRSPRVRPSAQLRDYASPSFPAGRPILEAIVDLTARIHRDFQFDAKATTVHTPLEELLRLRRGVCQDFAHLAIGCARSMGLPSRYVSGYLRTIPPPGKPRMIGADASHAWASVHCGPLGWVDFDPTNNALIGDAHITIAWGRDYSDVCPIQGVFVGGGEHSMGVNVDVLPADEKAA